MITKRIKYIAFIALIFACYSSLGQIHKKELELCRDLRLQRHDETCTGDTTKRNACNSLIGNYLLKKERYFIKRDSIEYLIDEMNKTGSRYHYYLQMDSIVYFDWGVCNSKSMSNDRTLLLYLGFYDKWDDIIDFKAKIGKESKFSLTLNSGTSGKTFYREDLK